MEISNVFSCITCYSLYQGTCESCSNVITARLKWPKTKSTLMQFVESYCSSITQDIWTYDKERSLCFIIGVTMFGLSLPR